MVENGLRSSQLELLAAEWVDSLKAGDYLLIAFGHNDEKSDDDTRFTDASLPYTNEASFGWHLYEYYIKLAEEKTVVGFGLYAYISAYFSVITDREV